MRHFETQESGAATQQPRQSVPTSVKTDDITAVREKAHALMAGQTSLLTAPVFELRATDARRYRLQLNGSGRMVDITRQNGTALTALREITLPLNRPIILLIEHGDDFASDAVNEIATMGGVNYDGPTLCPGSLVMCGTDHVYWA